MAVLQPSTELEPVANVLTPALLLAWFARGHLPIAMTWLPLRGVVSTAVSKDLKDCC